MDETYSIDERLSIFLQERFPSLAGIAGFLAAFLSIAAIALLTGIVLRANHLFFQKVLSTEKRLHLKYAESLMDVLISVSGIFLLGVFFGQPGYIHRLLLGSTGLAVAIIGFAAQSVLGDVVAGFMLGWSRPFEIGDRIQLDSSGITGMVYDMTVRHVVIRRFDGLYVVVPNSVINKEILHNDSFRHQLTASYMQFGISYGSDIPLAMRIIQEAVLDCRYAVEYPGENAEGKSGAVYVKELDASSVLLQTVVWAKNADESFLAESAIRQRVKKDFDEQGVEIPYPYMNVLLQDMAEGRREEESAGEAVRWKRKQLERRESGIGHILETVDAFCGENGISSRESLRVHLLAEEILGIANGFRLENGGIQWNFWIQRSGQNCELHLASKKNLGEEGKRAMLSLYESLNASGNSGIIARIQEVFCRYLIRKGSGQQGEVWSLSSYRKKAQEGDGGTGRQDGLSYDAFSRSIIAKLADDVNIGVQRGTVEMVVYRKIWSTIF